MALVERCTKYRVFPGPLQPCLQNSDNNRQQFPATQLKGPYQEANKRTVEQARHHEVLNAIEQQAAKLRQLGNSATVSVAPATKQAFHDLQDYKQPNPELR